MKKTLFTLALAGACLIGAFSQNPVLDSLEAKLAQSKKDSFYIDLRVEYINKKMFYAPSDPFILPYNNETLLLARRMNYPRGVMFSLLTAGMVYQYLLSDPYRAMDCYYYSLNVAEHYPHLKKFEANILGNISNIYSDLQDYPRAIEYTKKVLAKGVEDSIAAYTTIGNAFGGLKQTDSALFYYDKGLVLANEKKKFHNQANLYINKALALSWQGKNEEAETAIHEGIRLAEKHQLNFMLGTAYANAATIYLASGDYSKAESYSLKLLDATESLDNLSTRAMTWGTLADVYEHAEKYKKALHAYKQYHLLNDSLSKENRQVDIARKELTYEQERKNAAQRVEQARKDALAQAEITRQEERNRLYLVSSTIILVLVFAIFIVYRKRQRAIQRQKELILESRVSQSELKALRSQMNPHFIFNALNSIADYIHKNDADAADYYLTKFAKLMRSILENSGEREISVAEELKMMEMYMQLEAARLNGKFTYRIEVGDGIDVENTRIPPLIIQPFIENSIWHGMSGKEGNGEITIAVSKKGPKLCIAIEDNGVGRRPTAETGRKSFGVRIVDERLDILNKTKNTDAKAEIIDLAQGTRVEITFTIEE